MSNMLKVVIAVASALLLGFVVGYVAGASGKGAVVERAEASERRARAAEDALKQERGQSERRLRRLRQAKLLLSAKEHLLRAQVELYANNYGLASQHLSMARTKLKRVQKRLKKGGAKRVKELYDRIAGTQTVVMRLDPMARKFLQDLLADLQRIPGAR